MPLLFILASVGSFAVKANLVTVVESELLGFFPDHVRTDLIETVIRFASHPGSLSIVSVLILLFVVNTLFLDIYRAAAAALGTTFSVGRGRLLATVANTVFLVLAYAATLVTVGARVVGRRVAASPLLLAAGARVFATVVIAFVLTAIFRAAARRKVRVLPTYAVSIAGAAAWQIISSAGAAVAGLSSSRFLIYGVLTWAVLYLVYMRILAEIVIHCALWVREIHRRRVPPEPPPQPD